ncbi:MAG: hypothetical protein NT150_03495, partial [Bacteroidetes bacterium]|nr:hypothetical protein [Bacteroidota bacterium]
YLKQVQSYITSHSSHLCNSVSVISEAETVGISYEYAKDENGIEIINSRIVSPVNLIRIINGINASLPLTIANGDFEPSAQKFYPFISPIFGGKNLIFGGAGNSVLLVDNSLVFQLVQNGGPKSFIGVTNIVCTATEDDIRQEMVGQTSPGTIIQIDIPVNCIQGGSGFSGVIRVLYNRINPLENRVVSAYFNNNVIFYKQITGKLVDKVTNNPFDVKFNLAKTIRDNCLSHQDEKAEYEVNQKFSDALNAYKSQALQNIQEKCLGAMLNESMHYTYQSREYHYTLYYYDQAGNLVQTVPPAGVDKMPIDEAHGFDSKGNYSSVPLVAAYQPKHRLISEYKYNSLNQLVYQNTPDGNESFFHYDDAGRLRFSQNAEQRIRAYEATDLNSNGKLDLLSDTDEKFSYTKYDTQGRITEIGESTDWMVSGISFREKMNEEGFPSSINRTQITQTIYDEKPSQIVSALDNLRGRISAVLFKETSSSTERNAAFYSYDEYGNVKTLYQRNNDLAYLGQSDKKISYSYDLISSNVNKVSYQAGQPDQFYHRYAYDADNRLVTAETSDDNMIWEVDAKYKYFLHGSLARIEIGHDQIQGVDYAYTKHGWLIGMNSSSLESGFDLGGDAYAGNLNHNFAVDAAGFSLGYYDGAYKPIDGSTSTNVLKAELVHDLFSKATIGADLFNGNISHMITGIYLDDPNTTVHLATIPSSNLMAYRYDQLNRIKVARSGTENGNDWIINTDVSASAGKYEMKTIFDPMGNITNLSRRYKGAPMDDLTYSYYRKTDTENRKQIVENRLYNVADGVSSSMAANDYKYSTTVGDVTVAGIAANDFQYSYDNVGNLINDKSEDIEEIIWTVSGKVKEVKRVPYSLKPDLEFVYDAAGNRISKTVKHKVTEGSIYEQGLLKPEDQWTTTYYVRDASGNVMAVYNKTTAAVTTNTYKDKLQLTEQHIYGSSRLGLKNSSMEVASVEYNGILGAGGKITKSSVLSPMLATVSSTHGERIVGQRAYELSNHLGNVLATVSDRKFAVGSNTQKLLEQFEGNDGGFVAYGGATRNSNNTKMEFSTTNQWAGIERDIVTEVGKSYSIEFDFGLSTSPYNAGAGFAMKNEEGGGNVTLNQSWVNQNGSHVGLVFRAESTTSKFYLYNGNNIGVSASFSINDFRVKEVIHYEPQILSSADYDPYGCVIEDRQFTTNTRIYGFEGQRIDDELFNGAYAMEYRVHNPQIGRFLSTDPREPEYPWNSAYAFAENKVINGIDLEGAEYEPTYNDNGGIESVEWVGFDKVENSDGSISYVAPEGTISKGTTVGGVSFMTSGTYGGVMYKTGDFQKPLFSTGLYYTKEALKTMPELLDPNVSFETEFRFDREGEATSITLRYYYGKGDHKFSLGSTIYQGDQIENFDLDAESKDLEGYNRELNRSVYWCDCQDASDNSSMLMFFTAGVSVELQMIRAAAASQGAGLVTVGRWMSQAEYDVMASSGRMVEGAGGQTFVAKGGPTAFNAAAKGSVYAEFQVPMNSLLQGGQANWYKVIGPNAGKAMQGLLGKQGGQLLPQIKNLSKVLQVK